MSKIPPDNENFQTIRLLHHSLVFPLKNPFPPINQTAKVCFATIERINAYRRERRARLKGDPDHEAKLKEERRRYYERKKADPERYQKKLAMARERRKRPEVRAKEAAYLRKRRAALRAALAAHTPNKPQEAPPGK